MQRHFDVVIERDEEGTYPATVPQLPGCHTQGRSLDELMERIREAVGLCLEVEGAPAQALEFVGIQRITNCRMSRSPRLTGPELISALAKAGFTVTRVRGSHHFLRHHDGRGTAVPG